jgi:hypothetical protein
VRKRNRKLRHDRRRRDAAVVARKIAAHVGAPTPDGHSRA